MTSNLTVCHMAAQANLQHLERAAIRASLIDQAVANRRLTSATTRRFGWLGRLDAIMRPAATLASPRRAAINHAERA
jgi:hypothetical protein